ncbi:hypothetical protein ASPZODRAFT_697014 [Penicilliopsis zonata CBS 506.65]|uniref:Mediator of RNA polymerase II transcription subunit 8 n=1 Tax=Penicilliopsis zonata CBS 506.65 TaxID=1073090 RepID=A0A1L9SBS3_9EURO|nr:hypothetical protein ASPZODRAFT_697014 [Penicilliopsis zonata CBS 506.65]OJJ44594.1 hypothetical protein ASPZODRAFT_697014 [Penicilliopsis zonata CBS 506.65]
MATLTQDQIKTLEQTRQRLTQLTRSLGSLVASLNQSDPLPSWTSLQSQASIISNNLLSASEQLSANQDLLSSIVAYPGPEYPASTQARSTLEQLLRTKLDPRVDDWVGRGRTQASGVGDSEAADMAELWAWAPIEANQEARRRNWGGNFTLEEREMGIENVVTGLKRELEDDDDEEDEEDEDEDDDEDRDGGNAAEGEMEIVGAHRRSGGGLEFDLAVPPKMMAPEVPLDGILRFMTMGQAPKQR